MKSVPLFDSLLTRISVFRFEKDDFMLNRIPVKMSPHQIGIQEVLALSDIRDRCPEKVTLYGVIPLSYDAGAELSPLLNGLLPTLARSLVAELRTNGHDIIDHLQ